MIYVEDVYCFLFVCSHSDMDVLNRIFPSSFASRQCWCMQLDNCELLSIVPLKTLITLQNKEMLMEIDFLWSRSTNFKNVGSRIRCRNLWY